MSVCALFRVDVDCGQEKDSTMASADDETTRLRSQLQRQNEEMNTLLAQLREKDSVISELNSTIELLRIGFGHLHRPRVRGIGISAEPASTTNIDTKLACHAKPHRSDTDVLRSKLGLIHTKDDS